ncbi:response regulator transcription factor [Allosphingosinicella deserti]|uniref:response regulator transcription factor n=1 Tax=Allosphingosinicella deserti TaxID=2116704 RepID=UPI001304F5FE|nr:response regulator [Sphingomonas deserti]
MTRPVVHLVDDEDPVRRSIQLMLKVMGYDVLAYDSGTALLAGADALKPGCILLDLRMPDVDGLEVQRRLRRAAVDSPIVMMSGHGDLAVALQAMRDGAIAFLEKPFAKSALKQALDLAFLKLLDPAGYRAYLEEASDKVAVLDPAARAILGHIARGASNDGVAAMLGLSPPAIDVARARLFSDLGVDSVTDALRVAFAAGLGLSSE